VLLASVIIQSESSLIEFNAVRLQHLLISMFLDKVVFTFSDSSWICHRPERISSHGTKKALTPNNHHWALYTFTHA